jgi:hypothetical protein
MWPYTRLVQDAAAAIHVADVGGVRRDGRAVRIADRGADRMAVHPTVRPSLAARIGIAYVPLISCASN